VAGFEVNSGLISVFDLVGRRTDTHPREGLVWPDYSTLNDADAMKTPPDGKPTGKDPKPSRTDQAPGSG